MKRLLLTLMVALTVGSAAVGSELDDYFDRLTKVRQSISRTSNERWLPLWNAIANEQLKILKLDSRIDLTDSLTQAVETLKDTYVWGWDDFFWCGTTTPDAIAQLRDDIKYDYCRSAVSEGERLSRYGKNQDPLGHTVYGGFLWNNEGTI